MHFKWTLCFAIMMSCSTQPENESTLNADVSPTNTAAFDARHEFVVHVPEGAENVRVWFAMPSRKDPAQQVSNWTVECVHETRVVVDELGNEFLFLDVSDPTPGTIDVHTSFHLVRSEVNVAVDPEQTRPHTPEELKGLSSYLVGSSQSIIDDNARQMAADSCGGEANPIRAARAVYDAILSRIEYHVKDPQPDSLKTMMASGKGSSVYCYEQCTGNCTDFHSLFAAVARAANIPTRIVYGSFFKGPLSGKDKDQSYHCWIEFHAPNIGWIPLDVAVADIFVDDFVANENNRPRANLTVADGYHGPDPELVDYYFGNLEPRRVLWHWGTDLVMKDPRQKGAPLLWNPKAYAEIDGLPGKVDRKLTFRDVAAQ